MVPLGTNTAASLPVAAAASASSAATVGSSPHTSSPTSAAAAAARISGVGSVNVSERSSTAAMAATEECGGSAARLATHSQRRRPRSRPPARPQAHESTPATAPALDRAPIMAARAGATPFAVKLWTTNQHATAQVLRLADGAVVAAASTAERGLRGEGGASLRPTKEVRQGEREGSWAGRGKEEAADRRHPSSRQTCARLGALLAERAAAAGVSAAAWRRARGQRYHGRAAELLGAARAAGLKLT